MAFKKTFFIGVIVIFCIPLTLRAGDLLTLREAVEKVLSSNPDVQVANLRALAAKNRIPQAKALDDPTVGVMFDDVPIDTANVRRSEEIDYRIEQKIPFPGKRYVRGREARFEAAAVREESRGQVQDVVLDLKTTYYEIFRIERQLTVNRETQGLFRQLLASAEASYATGKTTAEPPLKIQVELSKLQNEEINLDQERTTHLSHLKALLNHATHEDLEISHEIRWPSLKADLEQIRAMALEARPELKTLEQTRKSNASRLTSARQGLIPDFTVGFQYGQRPQAPDTWSGTAMINLPLFFWGKNRGEIGEAKASLKATEAMQRSMRIHTQHEVDQGYSAFRAAEKLVESYRKGILPQAKTNLTAARLAYSANKVDLLTLIDAARTYQELQGAFYENQARVGMTFAELERLVGKDLGGDL